MNQLFKQLGGQMPGPMGDFSRMMKEFREFKANFQGDPEAEVKKLLQSGKMSQEQLDQLQKAAQIFQGLLG